VGKILPATQEDCRLKATLEDGSDVIGETAITTADQLVRRISLVPDSPRPAPGVVEAITDADLVVLGPGSLYTSILPNIAVPGIAAALCRTPATNVVVANLVSERGEAAGLSLTDHLSMIEEHAGDRFVDAVLVDDSPIADDVLERYRAEGAAPLFWPRDDGEAFRVERRGLLARGPKLRHDPVATSEGLVAAWRAGLARTVTGDRM